MSHKPSPIIETILAFSRLGLLSFGGPVAHLAYMRSEFVEKRNWLSDSEFTDLVALCQFLPGPASSQVVFALGMRRAGLFGALLASICFMAPATILMIGFAYGVASIGDIGQARWLHGLKLAAVAVVAQAVFGMLKNLCPDWPRKLIALCSAVVLICVPDAKAQLAVIAVGGAVGFILFRSKVQPAIIHEQKPRLKEHVIAAGAIFVWLLLLLLLPAISNATKKKNITQIDAFYRAGSLVFGGGHVVLPLLQREVVPRGWLTNDSFLAGYGAVQSVPGPLFTFSAYLGTAIRIQSDQPAHAWIGGLMCLLAIFLPAWLLIGGALPFWHSLRSRPAVQAGLWGANAVVVGVLGAALWHPIISEGVHTQWDILAALIAIVSMQLLKVPNWLIVLLLAAAGQWVL